MQSPKNWLTSKLQGTHTFHSKKLRSWWRLMSCQMSENEKLFRRKWADRSFAHEIFCWQLKNYELILTSGPWTRTSEVRYSHVRAPNDPCVPPPSCHFVSTRSGRWISQVFNQKNETEYGDMHDGPTAGIWLASGKSTLTPPRLPHPAQMSSFSCLQQRVGLRGYRAQLWCRMYRHHDAISSGQWEGREKQ